MKLPSVYANKIEKNINNNSSYYRNDLRNGDKKDLTELKECFDRNGYVDRLSVDVETDEGVRSEKLVLCKRDYFVNINNKRIYFKDIINYKIKR